ncbi:MAG: hypothetical protein F9K44_14195, partial [Hyphomicrobiaceae bacterium]
EYEPVQPTYAQSASRPGSRVHKPSLDEMTVGRTEIPLGRAVRPARTVDVLGPAEKKSRRGRARKTGRPGA